jgi:hypothetical protein
MKFEKALSYSVSNWFNFCKLSGFWVYICVQFYWKMHFSLVFIFILGTLGYSFFQGDKLPSKDFHYLDLKSGFGKAIGANNFSQGFDIYAVL